jgi:formate hydrogenlyase subunit 6/NADH:ubiquinone oxidoreductase subunit I
LEVSILLDEVLNAFQRGFYQRKDLEKEGALPTDDVVKMKRVAVIECLEEIPCNPCGFICPVNAIRKDSLVDPPIVDWERCVGCTKCVPICPGLAIFLQWIDGNKGYITLPYEFLPEPRVGDKVLLFDRSGRHMGFGRIVFPTYQSKGKSYPLWCVTVEVADSKLVYDVRSIKIINN